ncbi:MAG: hypothetical protein J6C13_04790 [Clostridia bacterium]|nr:hypothetical protein [Clostridia bacterium]
MQKTSKRFAILPIFACMLLVAMCAVCFGACGTPEKIKVTFSAGENGVFEGQKTQIVQEYDLGETIYAPSNPTPKVDTQFVYTFAGWDKTVAETATKEETYTATYTKTARKYLITFEAGEGYFGTDKDAHIYSASFAYGTTPTPPSVNPTRDATATTTYTFDGWGELTAVDGTKTYTANWTESKIQYYALFKTTENPEGTKVFFDAAEAGQTPTLSQEAVAQLPRVTDVNGFVGVWDYTLINSNCEFTQANDVVFGDGTSLNPYLIDNFESSLAMIASASDPANSGVCYKLIGDVNFADYKTIDFVKDATDLSCDLFTGTLDGNGYKLLGLTPELFGSNGGYLFNIIQNAELKNFDIILGDVLAGLGLYLDGDSVIFNNVDIYNSAEDAYTLVTTGDTNESAYCAHSRAKTTKFINCTNYANYKSDATNFGIFLGGYNYIPQSAQDQSAKTLIFDSCVNYGDVASSGMVSVLYGNGARQAFTFDAVNEDDNTITITNCINNGTITGSDVALFCALPGQQLIKAECDALNQKVTNNGTLTKIETLNATYGANATNDLIMSATSGELSAGKYVLDIFAYSKDANNATLRVTYSVEVTFDSPANSVVFDSLAPSIIFMSKDAFATAYADEYAGIQTEDWKPITGYTYNKYAVVTVDSGAKTVIVTDLEDGYAFAGTETVVKQVTYYNEQGVIAGLLKA